MTPLLFATIAAMVDPVRVVLTLLLVSLLPQRWWAWLVAAAVSGLVMAALLDQTNEVRDFGYFALPSLGASAALALLMAGGKALLARHKEMRRRKIDAYLESAGERPLD